MANALELNPEVNGLMLRFQLVAILALGTGGGHVPIFRG